MITFDRRTRFYIPAVGSLQATILTGGLSSGQLRSGERISLKVTPFNPIVFGHVETPGINPTPSTRISTSTIIAQSFVEVMAESDLKRIYRVRDVSEATGLLKDKDFKGTLETIYERFHDLLTETAVYYFVKETNPEEFYLPDGLYSEGSIKEESFFNNIEVKFRGRLYNAMGDNVKHSKKTFMKWDAYRAPLTAKISNDDGSLMDILMG